MVVAGEVVKACLHCGKELGTKNSQVNQLAGRNRRQAPHRIPLEVKRQNINAKISVLKERHVQTIDRHEVRVPGQASLIQEWEIAGHMPRQRLVHTNQHDHCSLEQISDMPCLAPPEDRVLKLGLCVSSVARKMLQPCASTPSSMCYTAR